MFEHETEIDQLPRAAPKPSGSTLDPTSLSKPQVPEVSILYGQQQQHQQDATKTTTTQSYAAWKKQILPRVTFPPEGAEVTGIIGGHTDVVINGNHKIAAPQEYMSVRSNLYPLRTVIQNAPVDRIATNPMDALQYRRSLGSFPFDMVAVPTHATVQQPQRRSLDAIAQHTDPVPIVIRPNTLKQETLTICASTQTDGAALSPSSIQSFSTLASKTDLEQLFTEMQSIREQQLRLMQICETLLLQQQQTQMTKIDQFQEKTYFRDVAIQCEWAPIVDKENMCPVEPNAPNSPQRQNPAEYHNYYVHLKDTMPGIFNSPGNVPAAQSTAYRANTPCSSSQQKQLNKTNNNMLPKASTEKSMVMNELALKYLPSEKLTELMEDLSVKTNIATPQQQAAARTSPLHAVENLSKNDNDLSNDSYKYMKKYRLLTDEQRPVQQNGFDYQQQKQSRQSPYKPLVPSPLTISPQIKPTQRTGEMLDLEHIRSQPKLL